MYMYITHIYKHKYTHQTTRTDTHRQTDRQPDTQREKEKDAHAHARTHVCVCVCVCVVKRVFHSLKDLSHSLSLWWIEQHLKDYKKCYKNGYKPKRAYVKFVQTAVFTVGSLLTFLDRWRT